jgi:hypothetical protein
MPQRAPVFLCALEETARRHRYSVGRRRIESLVSGVHDLGRVGHAGKNLLARPDRIKLARFGKRQLLGDRYWQIRFFRVED